MNVGCIFLKIELRMYIVKARVNNNNNNNNLLPSIFTRLHNIVTTFTS